jgi:carbon storage regulator
MLVLSCKVGERIHIGGMTVEVISHKNNKIRLGVEAPPEVPVFRGKVYERIQAGEPQRRAQVA